MKKKYQVELWEPSQLKPYEKNAKVHDDEHIEKLANSMERIGQITPIVVNKDGVIIAGHGRRLAALKLGLKHVKVIVRDDISKAEEKQMRIADNATAGLKYNEKTLRDEIGELMMEGIDLDDLALSTGLTHDYVEHMDDPTIDMSDEAFSDSVNEDVEKMMSENYEMEQQADGSFVSVGKAFGFTAIPNSTVRKVNIFIGMIENQTQKTGVEAFDAWLEEYTRG